MSHRTVRRAAHRARGFTLVELMMALGLALFIALGAMMIIIAAARSGRGAQDRSDLQRGGRAALTLLGDEIENAGLGLPKVLAFRSGSATTLSVAHLDLRQEWTVLATAGDATAGTITLASATPVPTRATDVALAANEWVFFYQNPTVDGSGAGNHGHALLQLGAARPLGGTSLTIGSTNYSAAQTNFNLAVGRLPSTPHAQVLLRAQVTEIGLDTTNSFLYLRENGDPVGDPVARNVTALSFAYYVDADCDGQTDDRNGDGVIDTTDTVTSPFIARTSPGCPDTNTEVQVTAVEVRLTLRADVVDTMTDPVTHTPTQYYRTETFSQVVPTRNINTRAVPYLFIDNTGLCTGGGC